MSVTVSVIKGLAIRCDTDPLTVLNVTSNKATEHIRLQPSAAPVVSL